MKQKGGKLLGGALDAEVLGSSRSVLFGASRGGKSPGLQQWFSPPEIAALIADVIDANRAMPVLDLTAGGGDLLSPWPRYRRYGIEIDADHARDAPYDALLGDVQRAYGLLRIGGLSFPRIVANPPFGLTWQHPSLLDGAPLNSTLACAHMILSLLDRNGVAALVCGTDRLRRELLADNDVDRCAWAIVDIEGAAFEGSALPTSIVFLTPAQNRSIRTRLHFTAPLTDLRALTPDLVAAMRDRTEYVAASYYGDGPRVFSDVVKAYAQRYPRSGKPRYDITLRGGRLTVHLGALGRLLSSYSHESRLLDQVNGQPPNYFAINARDWRTVTDLLDEGIVTASPEALQAVERVIAETRLLLRPMYPVPQQMRLGFLDDLSMIRCRRDDDAHDFEEGKRYPITVKSQVTIDHETKLVEKRNGDVVARDFEIERRVLSITINGRGFDECPDDIRYLAEHFDLPDPGDLATDHPQELERVKRVLLDIQDECGPADDRCIVQDGKRRYVNRDGWQIKPFQLEDLARAILKQRAVLAHDPGLGKTAQQLLAAEACYRLGYTKRLALFVAPQDLHQQWQREALKFIGRTLQLIRTPADAAKARRAVRGGAEGFWITHYEALSLVGTRDEVLPVEVVHTPRAPRMLREVQARRAALEHSEEWKEAAQRRYANDYAAWEREFQAVPADDWRARAEVSRRRPAAPAPCPWPENRLTTLDACPRCLTPAGPDWDGLTCKGTRSYRDRDGTHWVGCGYTHRRERIPTVGSILASVFKRGVICIDELSMVRGDTSRRSLAVRGLRAACRFGASATPIANFVNDCFWGVGWVLGYGTPRFPYAYDGGKRKFEEDFCVIEHMIGDDDSERAGQRVRRKVLPEVTNLSMLWRLFSMSVLRRRKEDTGEAIVPKRSRVIEVPAGRAQLAMHKGWLEQFPAFFIERNPGHPLVEAGMVERFAAGIGMLAKLEYAATLPEADPDYRWLGVPGVSNYTPKLMRALQIIEKHVDAGDKVLVGSALMETGPLIARMLRERGINAVHITEQSAAGRTKTKNPRARAREVTQFINGDATVLCAGVQAMKLGHNLDIASTVVLLGLPWSHEAKKQFLDRVHRLTSKRPVTVYLLVTKGMIDERKLTLLDDKEGASDVALDGRLVDQQRERHDWNKTLQEMRDAGVQITGEEVEERTLREQWERDLPDLDVTDLALADVLDLAPRQRARAKTSRASWDHGPLTAVKAWDVSWLD